ncbi:hypothetical protein JBW_00864 [Pelosinus fermentans JBW45]|uniref:Uncharacterized protein n=1 Tax=Pelosinus fermentans JBW45 TaxID=1192197 RepID=I9NUP3_9FIRM|nr:hypothetical protein JBW_00864 [Pelosinus fermentans JBW45]
MQIKKHNIYIDELNLVRSQSSFKAALCCCYFSLSIRLFVLLLVIICAPLLTL